MIRAVIDIGTNSVRLLVAEVSPEGRLETKLQAMHQPRLGQGVDRAKQLAPEAMARTSKAVGDLYARAKKAGAASVTVVGTSALRDAANRQAFIDEVARQHGLDVTVLSGEEEAALSFYGAARGLSGAGPERGANGDTLFVLDVGGGSTELTYGTGAGHMEGRISVDVGAVRMTELCIRSDPPSHDDWQRLADEVARGLVPVEQMLKSTPFTDEKRLLAVGGTATTLAAIDIGSPQYDSTKVHGHPVSWSALRGLLETMRDSTVAERRALPTMQPERADIIIAGTFIVNHVVEMLGTDGFTASEADLLVGALQKPNYI